MAIKVVQGLIDGGRLGPDSSRSQSVAGSSNHLSLQQQALIQQHNNASRGRSEDAVHQSEAALTTFRSNRGSKGDSEKVRDSDSADRLADEIAERLSDHDGKAKNAHFALSPATAREHFA